MMSHTKSKFADSAVNFSQILPIRWFCEVFYQNNIDTKNDVRMYRCFPVINALLWLWLILLTSCLLWVPWWGREGMRSSKTKLLQTIICLWKNARKRNNCSNISHRKNIKSPTQFLLVFLSFLLVFYQKPSLEKLQLF